MTFTLTGNVTGDPRTYAPQNSDKTILFFGVANNDKSVKDPEGQWHQVAVFFELEYWTKNPQHWLQKIKKGVAISTDIHDLWLDRWEKDGKSGVTLKATVIGVPRIYDRAPAESGAKTPEQHVEDLDDDIGF
jgi:single-stranded DNA-binding protein